MKRALVLCSWVVLPLSGCLGPVDLFDSKTAVGPAPTTFDDRDWATVLRENIKNGLVDYDHLQEHAEAHGYSVVRRFVGHGIGVRFHEPPDVFHYGRAGSGVRLVPHMVFTIEPMINAGGHELRVLDDNWTAVTLDGSLSAQ